jgi:hypothetical protein
VRVATAGWGGGISLLRVLWVGLLAILGAAVANALVASFSWRPVWLFRRIALGVLAVSLVADQLLLVFSPFPGTTVVAVAVLIVMHVVAWAVGVGTLTTLAVRNGEGGL